MTVNAMIKLYKRLESGRIAYHEAWVEDNQIFEHWGIAGTRGRLRTRKLDGTLDEQANLDRVLAKPLSEGFSPIDLDDHSVLLIEFPIDGFGTQADIQKRYALQDRMDQTLGWMGLGHCDGGSTGSGTMEVCCYVVDFDVAKRVIEKDLRGTEFGDYSRIYDESDE